MHNMHAETHLVMYLHLHRIWRIDSELVQGVQHSFYVKPLTEVCLCHSDSGKGLIGLALFLLEVVSFQSVN